MLVELLYFEGCPNYEAFLPHLRQVLREAGIAAEVALRAVESTEEAQRERFLGSPTLRIDGHDVEPGADERTDFGLKCRLYRSAEGLKGVPADALVLAAIGRSQA